MSITHGNETRAHPPTINLRQFVASGYPLVTRCMQTADSVANGLLVNGNKDQHLRFALTP